MNRDRGLKFPFQFSNGRAATVGGVETNGSRDEAVKVCAEHILLTEKRERVMFCEVGAGLGRFLFDVLPGAENFIVLEAREAMKRSCPRAVIGSFKYQMDHARGIVALSCAVRHNDSTQESVVRAVVRTN